MRTLLLLACLLLYVTADTTIITTCKPCGEKFCLTYHGGPFNFTVFTSSQKCADVYPALVSFYCDKDGCKSGCSMLVSIKGKMQAACSDDPLALSVIKSYDRLYSLMKGDKTASLRYNWCGCGSNGLATSDKGHEITVACAISESENGTILRYHGGGFNNDFFKRNSDATCDAYPIHVRTTCTSDCKGCKLETALNGELLEVCSEWSSGQLLINALNQVHTSKPDVEDDFKFDWCNCP